MPKSSSWLKRGATVVAPFAVMGLAIASPPSESSISTQQPAIEELLQRLEKRDALVADLQRRVRDLEQRATTTPHQESPAEKPEEQASATEPAPSAASTANPEPSTPPKEEAPVEGDVAPVSAVASTANPEPSTPPKEEAPARGDAAPAAPGRLEVDEEAAERALERTLVLQGALLLPFGRAGLQASFDYVRSEQGFPILLSEGENNRFIGEKNIRRNILTGNLLLRLGLPFDSQLELGVPYQYIDQEDVATVGLAARNAADNDAWGFGDFQLGLAKGLLGEGRWWPNLIGRVTWNSDFGETNNGISLGSGFNELTGSLTATKSQDPLVFFGRVFYGTTFAENNLDPGDNIGFSIGTFLAASPDTSLSFVLNQTFSDEFEVNGRAIDGTDRVISTFNLGASTIIGRGKLLNFTAGIGLTDAAPDYSVGVTFTMRFDIPGLS